MYAFWVKKYIFFVIFGHFLIKNTYFELKFQPDNIDYSISYIFQKLSVGLSLNLVKKIRKLAIFTFAQDTYM